MTQDDETRARVRRAGDELPVSPAPVADLLQQGRQARRRRTLTTVGVVVAAVAVVTSGAVAVGAQLTNNATDSPPISMPTITTPSTPSPGLSTPPGTRLIGRNGIGIAVPASWRVPAVGCQAGVLWDVPAAYHGTSCSPARVSSALVRVESYRSQARFYTPAIKRTRMVGHVRVSQYGPLSDCVPSVSICPADPRLFVGVLLSARADVLIYVRSSSRAQVLRILNTVFAVPDRHVAVPLGPNAKSLTAAGLRPRWESRVDSSRPEGTILETVPAGGDIVPVHSIVTILRSTRHPASTGCAGLHVDVLTPTGRIPIQRGNRTYQITISVGDTVSLETVGRCKDAVSLGYQESTVLKNQKNSGFMAARPGTAKVVVTIPMCAGMTDPTCRGGIATLGTLMINVRQ